MGRVAPLERRGSCRDDDDSAKHAHLALEGDLARFRRGEVDVDGFAFGRWVALAEFVEHDGFAAEAGLAAGEREADGAATLDDDGVGVVAAL